MTNARKYLVLAGTILLALTSAAQEKAGQDQSAAKSPKPDSAATPLRQQLSAEIQKVRDEVQRLRQELREELRQQVKMDLKQELRQELRQEVKMDLKQELRMELKMELMQELRSR